MRPGISKEGLATAGVVQVSAQEAAALCCLAEDGLFIPYRTLDEAAVVDGGKPYGRLRLENPREAKKYHQALDTTVHAYLPPRLKTAAVGGDLFLIEGEFKALSLMEAGFPAVGLSGFFGFALKGGEDLAPELAETIERLKPARILFCGDSDTALNYQFAQAAVRLATMVAPVPLLLPRLPYDGPGKGADDCREVLKDGFVDWWLALLTDAVPCNPGANEAALAVSLVLREDKAIVGLSGDAAALAEQRLVKLAAALHGNLLQQERIVAFAERKLKLRRAVFKKTVDALVKAAAQKHEPSVLEAYYDPARKSYWVPNDRHELVEVTETGLIRRLKKAGFSASSEHGELTAVDERIIQIQLANDVLYAGPLAGHGVGLQKMCGQHVLVTRSARLIEPGPGDCPNMDALVNGLLGDPAFDQVSFLLGWLKLAYETLAEGSLRHAQALAIAGPKNSGKSLLQNLITEILGGRSAKPYCYMCGATDFNGDLFGAEHLMIEDEVSHTDIRARRHFGARIKDFTVNTVQSCHGKNRQALSLKPFWRVSITLNDEPENLLILPPIDESLEDKFILLKASKATMPVDTSTAAGQRQFMTLLLGELPAFVRRLVEFQIPEHSRCGRFGITHFHHPDLLAALDETSPELRLLNLIDSMQEDAESPSGPWTGTAADLERALQASKFAYEARRLLDWNNATGTYLGRLAKKHPNRVKCIRTESRREWRINPGRWTETENDTLEIGNDTLV